MTTLNDVHKTYKKSLYIENTHLIDISLATYIGKDIVGEPLWLNPVAPSGFGKTTMIKPLLDLAFDWKDTENEEAVRNKKYNIFFVDELTSATFGSGAASKKREGDLGHWLEDQNSLLIISDLAPILMMDEDSQNRLFGKFRTLYDGYIKVDTGVKNKFYQNIHMNMLAFSTSEVRRHLDLHVTLGTRELTYEVPKVNDISKALTKRDTDKQKEQRSNVMKEFIDDLDKDWKYANEQARRYESHIIDMAKKISYWRAGAVTDNTGHLAQHIEPEYPMRVKNQLSSLFKSFVVIGVRNPLKSLLEVVDSCGNPLRREILRAMFNVTAGDTRPKDRINIYYLSNFLRISPRTILTNMLAMWDMRLIEPIIDSEEKYTKRIDYETLWIPLVNYFNT